VTTRGGRGKSVAVSTAAPEAFLLDLDGTLVDSERENIESVVRAARRHGAELSAEERQFVIGHSWNEIYEVVARNHALPVTMTQLIAQAVDEKRKLVAVFGHRALPGAVSAVKRFARTSKLAVVTGASTAEARDSIVGVGLADYISLLIAAEDYTRGKPAPEPYAQAIMRLGVSAARSIAIEDATPGILSARAAGARVIAVRAGNFAGYDLSPADLVVDTLDDVTDDLIARLLA
jgi:HAD superfamily hydrolase (TIGR01509 family)